MGDSIRGERAKRHAARGAQVNDTRRRSNSCPRHLKRAREREKERKKEEERKKEREERGVSVCVCVCVRV